MIYGYARVSTIVQLSGNSLEDQRGKLTELGCQEIVEEQFSAKTTDRPTLNELVAKLVAGDTLIVTKLDRLSRTAHEGNQLITGLIERGITVVIDNMGTISSRPMDKLVVTMLLAFAEFERAMIVERTQAGRAIARTKNGYRDGCPKKYNEHELKHAMDLINNGNSYKKVASMTKISESTLYRERRSIVGRG